MRLLDTLPSKDPQLSIINFETTNHESRQSRRTMTEHLHFLRLHLQVCNTIKTVLRYTNLVKGLVVFIQSTLMA